MLVRVNVVADKDLRLKLLTRVLPLLDRLHEVGTQRDTAGNRTLHYDQYVNVDRGRRFESCPRHSRDQDK